MKKEKCDIYETFWHAIFGKCTPDMDGFNGVTYGASLQMESYGKNESNGGYN